MSETYQIVAARNARFEVTIDLKRCLLTLEDRSLGVRWKTDAPFLRLRVSDVPDREAPDWFWGYPDPSEDVVWNRDQVAATASDGRIRISVSSVVVSGAAVDIEMSIVLEDDRVRFEVRGLPHMSELIVDFPHRLGALDPGEDGGLILPRGAGIFADPSPKRGSHVIENFVYSGGQNGYSMPLFGTVSGDNVLGAIIKTPYDCLLRGEKNAGEPKAYAVSPCWLFDGGRLMDARRVDYTGFNGDHVELSKWYRGDLIADGRYKTPTENVVAMYETTHRYGHYMS
jgi:hypothetical protein